MRKFVLALAALASLAPVAASAQPYGGRGDRGGYGYNQGGRESARDCFRSLRYVRNRWEAQRRREHCERLAYRGDRGRGYGRGY
jgi:hypothetical protein